LPALLNNGSHPSRVGRYAIVEGVGNGALGPVYAGVDEAIGRRVAVRVGKAGDPRVHQLAKVTGQVAHPNVVSVLDLGEADGAPFAVMELIDGTALNATSFSGPLERKLDVMLQVCDGLQAAHDRGVTHGGVKPSHVLLQPDGVVKLLDFGVEKRADVFASPEQLARERVTPRTDIFSAAATFQFLLTGRPPFASAAATTTEQPQSIAAADAPESLSRTLLKAMEKDPSRRHASINHLRAEIEQVRQGRQGDRQRILMAALDRYRDIETLLAERRALGRRLGMASIESQCDARLARLAAAFPEFARAGLDINHVGDIDPARASEALTELQLFHNDVAAEVSVLKAASGGRR
jgi:serine/threonine protein kinase